MSRFFAVLAVAVAVVAIPVASADPIDDLQAALNALVAWDPGFAPFAADPPPTSGHDFVVGSQRVTEPGTDNFQHIRISAHSGPNGEDPQGQVEVSYRYPWFPGGSADLHGDVICLSVFGPPFFVFPPTAFVWALLRQPMGVYRYVQLKIQDVGNPGPFMGQSPDQATFYLSQVGPGPDCGANGARVPGDASGNFVIGNS